MRRHPPPTKAFSPRFVPVLSSGLLKAGRPSRMPTRERSARQVPGREVAGFQLAPCLPFATWNPPPSPPGRACAVIAHEGVWGAFDREDAKKTVPAFGPLPFPARQAASTAPQPGKPRAGTSRGGINKLRRAVRVQQHRRWRPIHQIRRALHEVGGSWSQPSIAPAARCS